MKKITLLLIQSLSRLTIIIFPDFLIIKLKSLRNKIHLYRDSPRFNFFGSSSILAYPVTLLGEKYISIGFNVYVGTRAILTAWDEYAGDHFTPQIIIGDNVSIGEDSHITALNKIEIENDVLIGKKVTISDNSHGKNDFLSLSTPPIKRSLYSKGAVIIKSGVWLGDKVTVLGGVTIGKNSIIGANSVVTKDIPDNCIAGGIPAKIIKKIDN